MDELGISETIRLLEEMGRPAAWPLFVVDPSGEFVSFLAGGKPWYRSQCPCYEGYYLRGGTGSVKCRTAGELLPGVVWHNVCSKGFSSCPYYKEKENGTSL